MPIKIMFHRLRSRRKVSDRHARAASFSRAARAFFVAACIEKGLVLQLLLPQQLLEAGQGVERLEDICAVPRAFGWHSSHQYITNAKYMIP